MVGEPVYPAVTVAGLGSIAIGAAVAAQLARVAVPWDFRDLFQEFGARYGVDENLLHAIAWQESRMNPRAIGPQNNNGTRDYGLMQINDANFAALRLTPQSALDPRESVRAAAELIAEINRDDDVRGPLDVLAIYNAGPSRVAGRQGGPKYDAQGRYLNAPYVMETIGRYVFVQLAALAPLGG